MKGNGERDKISKLCTVSSFLDIPFCVSSSKFKWKLENTAGVN